jgi:hypothetical protein
MDLIKRHYHPLTRYLEPNKVLIIYGARRVGKTTLIQSFLSQTSLKFKFDSGDNIRVQDVLGSSDFERIKEYCSGYELIVLDEAQNIPNVGKGLKIIVDQVPGIHVVATGSSSFDLSNKVGEPLVGRQRVLRLFPISFLELSAHQNKVELDENLDQFLLFGLYPDVITAVGRNQKIEFLSDLVHSYLLKDILALENVKSPKILVDLLRILAFQVGSEVSLNELSNGLGVDVKTVNRYIDLLEKSFVLTSLGGFSRNLRNEITSKKKYYFQDIGIRNAIINSFNPISTRDDVGRLWENFLIIERMKKKTYQQIFSNDYFWRTYSKQEIDLIEERDGSLYPYEMKWKAGSYKAPSEWKSNYPGSMPEVITRGNYLSYIL